MSFLTVGPTCHCFCFRIKWFGAASLRRDDGELTNIVPVGLGCGRGLGEDTGLFKRRWPRSYAMAQTTVSLGGRIRSSPMAAVFG
jgi:hypothetical protein